MIPARDFKYDRTQFFLVLKALQKYQVGFRFWYIMDRKIIEGVVKEVNFKVDDYGMTHTSGNQLTITFNVIMFSGYSCHPINIAPDKLFDSREEVAEQFLKENDIPSELLRVIKQDKPKTTVGDLIIQLSNINPETDLEVEYWKVLKQIQAVYLDSIGVENNTNLDYWDCNCKSRYIHPASDEICSICKAERTNQPDSIIKEIRPENMFYPYRGTNDNRTVSR